MSYNAADVSEHHVSLEPEMVDRLSASATKLSGPSVA